MKTVTIEQLKKVAKDLIDDGSNIEYTRGICELIADVDGVEDLPHGERSIEIARELGLSEDVVEGIEIARELGLSEDVVEGIY